MQFYAWFMYLRRYMELAMYFRMQLNVILQREMQTLHSDQMNFKATRSGFANNNSHMKWQTLQKQ